MKKIAAFLIMICLITACNSSKSITTFEGIIDSINEENILVNCSHEVNRGDNGNINAIGYLCGITIHSTTKFMDQNGNLLKFEDLKIGDSIRINLSKPQQLSKSNRQFDATEIVLLEDQQS